MQDMLNKARERVATARAELDEAVAAGKKTAGIRATLDLAIEEADRIEAEAQAQEAEAQAAAQDAQRADAEAMAADAAASIQGLVDKVLTFTKPTVKVPHEPALNVLLAQRAAQEEDAAIKGHAEKVRALRERLARYEAERAEIGQRRAAGDAREDDIQRVHMLTVDIETLTGLIQRTEAEAPQRNELLTRGLQEWQAAWVKSTKEIQLGALHRACQLLEQALLIAVTAHRGAGGVRSIDHRLGPWIR